MEDQRKLQIYKTLEKKSFKDLYEIYYQVKRSYFKNKTKKNYLLLKLIEKIVDLKDLDEYEKSIINNSYQSYPDYNDPNFNTEITKKAEFYHCKSLLNILDLEERCFSKVFELGNHQKFLKNFINKNTPYKGILIFHGVGVGKTCSAVTISNSFIDLYKKEDKKIICLVSKNIQPNWMNTIYNPDKGDNQCNGENFEMIIRNIDNKINTSGKVKKLIKEYYEFYGYQQFSNKVKKLIQSKSSTSKNRSIAEIERKIIHNYFSNRILIIDEIHNLRDDNLDNSSKDTVIFLNKVIKYSENLRLVLMSATPMYNKATEIQWLMNLLLKNDGRPTISKNDIFDENDIITSHGIEVLKKKSRGYISYVRGENPITFPIRLHPDDNNDILCIDGKKYLQYPKKSYLGEEYSDNVYQFKFLKMYYNQLIDYQQKIYDNYILSLPNVVTTTNKVAIQISEQRAGVQISNIVYPSVKILTGEKEITNKNYKYQYGGSGLFQLIDMPKKTKGNRYSYNKEYRKNIDYPIFDLDYIGSISSKIHNLLKGIQEKKSEGIIFIYTEFLPSGIIPLAFALEHMGFEKYSGNILDYPEWKQGSQKTKREPIDYEFNTISKKKKGFKRAKYIVLSGNQSLSPNNSEEIKELVSDKNKNGENIKVVLGTVVASEGLDLKNIREIHILDPWYHLSRIEQIIGRGIRYCSHIGLPKEERNVTVYMHVGGTSPEVESIDTYTYRKAEEKAVSIGLVEKVLKENAIDCGLNKQINHIRKKQISPIKLVTSRGTIIKKQEVYDKEYSKVCSFSQCEYECDTMNVTENDINYDTFSIKNSEGLFKEIEKIILELYEINNFYTIEELKKRIIDQIDTNVVVIYYALYNMIDQKKPMWNKHKISGYLINHNNYYLFQPHNNTDESLPLYYRNNSISSNNTLYIPLEDNLFTKKVVVKNEITCLEVIKKIDTVEKNISENNFEQYILNFNKMNYFYHSLDNLSYNEKAILLKDIFKEYFETNKIKDKKRKLIFDYYEKTIIYEKDDNYYLLENTGVPIGFYLFNTDKFFEKKKTKKEIDELEKDYSFYIYKNETFYITNELDDGNLIESSIKTNLLKNKDKYNILKVSNIWGYSFKLENEEHVFKLVDEKIKSPNKLPGRIISQIAKKISIISFLRIYFKKYHDKLLDEDINIDDISKQFFYLYIEMIMRNNELKQTSKHVFIPYDIVFLKYIK